MCRTIHAILQVLLCGVQMLVRVFMTIILMIENLIRMILQTLYNLISFILQIVSLIPICVVFLITARLKCFMCGGGGPCPVNRGGACDCVMSFMAIGIIIIIFRATGVLDKIFFSLGYAKARPSAHTRFVPTPGLVTECSREAENAGFPDTERLISNPFSDKSAATAKKTTGYAVTEENMITTITSKMETTTTSIEASTAEPTPEATTEVTVEATTEPHAEVTAEAPPEATVEGTAEAGAEVSAEAGAEASSEVTAEAGAEPPAEAGGDVTAEMGGEATEEVSAEASVEAATEVSIEATEALVMRTGELDKKWTTVFYYLI